MQGLVKSSLSERYSERDSPGENMQSAIESAVQMMQDEISPSGANLANDMKFTKLEIVQ